MASSSHLVGKGVARLIGAGVSLMMVCSGVFAHAQDAPRKVVGIIPVVSNVADIPADAATDLFVNTLMETNRFSIKPPDANGSFAGAEYVFEPTISDGKAKSNVLGFLKDTVTANTPVNLTVRVFDPRTNVLVNTVTVKSGEGNAPKVSLGDVQSLMGAVGASSAQSSESSKLEERIGGLMQSAVSRLVSQLGGVGAGMQRSGAMRTR
ncbi:MAG: hypothetical protein LZF86_230003 [Nitrospira sp.]|nr:MAG: hypothetical protein LZF86_230003 [Nitrospira sp.]